MIEAVMRELALICDNTIRARWLSQSDRAHSVADGFRVVDIALEKCPEIRFSIHEDELRVNDADMELKHERERAFVQHLAEIEANHFTLTQGLAQEEFSGLIDLLCKRRVTIEQMGGFAKAVSDAGFAHVRAKKVVFREISEDETIIAKREAEAAAAAEKQKIESAVLDYLSGKNEDAPDYSTADKVRRAAEDSGQMADLVMQAAQNRQTGSDTIEKKEMVQIVGDCLKRTFDGLMKDPSSHTQKGSKAIEKTLKELESELLGRLGLQPGSDAAAAPVTEAVDQMTGRLKVQTMAMEYAKKVKALETSEKRILRFIKMQGLASIDNPQLAQQLGDEGLDVSGWHRLLALSEISHEEAEAAESIPDSARAVEQLATLLGHLERSARDGAQPAEPGAPEQFSGEIDDVSTQMQAVTDATQMKIDALVEAVRADMLAVDALERRARQEGKGPHMSRRQIMKVLAEIGQELLQPLTVISSSIEMVRSKSLGEVSNAQEDILKLAAESAGRIKTLIDMLEKLSGLPTTLSPDKDIEGAIQQWL
ncbi:MAG: hypothetical protein JXR37_15155 [Kiritimatiellae bacterium]|nr:hypothetical protein [Kiritimatiellia bacterium]